MNNIFEGAKFGYKFLTKDGRKAVVTDIRENCIDLFVERGNNKVWGEFTYVINDNGKFDDSKFDALNIVSRYQEPIDEEKLDKLEEEYEESLSQDYFWIEDCDDGEGTHGVCSVCEIEKAFKAGYRSKEE